MEDRKDVVIQAPPAKAVAHKPTDELNPPEVYTPFGHKVTEDGENSDN